MSIKENIRQNKNQILYFVSVLLVCTLTVFCTSTSIFKKSARELWHTNAFYIPSTQKQKVNFDLLERYAFFGREYADTKEHVNILPDTEQLPLSPSKENSESAPLKELPSDADKTIGLLPIIETDLSTDNILSLNNTTFLRPNTALLLEEKYDFEYTPNEVLVLVLHTHATECYSSDESTYYDKNTATRTSNTEQNMVSVGKVFADRLNQNGVGAVHCTVKHDEESYRDSYYLSAQTVKKYLEEYPTIKYVFDLHRDAVVYESGAKAKAVCETDGKKAAQIMLLAGSDAGGADFPHWKENLSLALKLANKLESKSPGISRSVALRGASYNQQYTNGSLLVEIGTDGNTLSEAKYSAEILADAFSELIKGE